MMRVDVLLLATIDFRQSIVPRPIEVGNTRQKVGQPWPVGPSRSRWKPTFVTKTYALSPLASSLASYSSSRVAAASVQEGFAPLPGSGATFKSMKISRIIGGRLLEGSVQMCDKPRDRIAVTTALFFGLTQNAGDRSHLASTQYFFPVRFETAENSQCFKFRIGFVFQRQGETR